MLQCVKISSSELSTEHFRSLDNRLFSCFGVEQAVELKVSLLNSKCKFRIQVPHFYSKFKFEIKVQNLNSKN